MDWISGVCSKWGGGDPRVVTRSQIPTRDLEIGETVNSGFARLAKDLREFFQGRKPGQDCGFGELSYTNFCQRNVPCKMNGGTDPKEAC